MSNYSNYVSPNGSPIIGTKEVIFAISFVTSISDDGEPDFDGGTDVQWDTSVTQRNDKGEILFVAEDGTDWPFSVLVKAE